MFSDKKALNASLMEVESKLRRLELEVREAFERASRVEAERGAARHGVVMA